MSPQPFQSERLELIVRNYDPHWLDVDLLLGEMPAPEKQLILKHVRDCMQGQINSRVLGRNVGNYVPLQRPDWDPNDPNYRS